MEFLANNRAGVSSIVVEETSVSSLKPYRANARTHTKHQIRQVANSIAAFGFTNPILIDCNNRIIAGHGRLEAAKLLGMDRVPTIRLEGLSEDQIRAYVLADNKLAANAGWDPQILAIELQYLVNLESADFDVTITGFEIPEIDALIAEVNESSEQESPVPEPDRDVPSVCQPGDVWKLDKHRIICGNALHETTFRTLMGAKRATGVFTDPPFNVRIDGHATGNGAIQHREFAMASGEMSEAEFVSFLTNAIDLVARFSTTHAIAYICMDWRHIADLIRAACSPMTSSRTCASGSRITGAWDLFTDPNTNLSVCFVRAKGRTETMFSWGSSAAIGRMSGNIRESRPCRSREGKGTCLLFTQQ
jgi:ParB/Sulfiredoxin domain